MRKSLQEQINYIMDTFEFERVRSVMEFLDWTWAAVGGVPSLEEIKQLAEYVMQNACERLDQQRPGQDTFVSTGGFCAHIYRWDSGDCMELTFGVSCASGNLA